MEKQSKKRKLPKKLLYKLKEAAFALGRGETKVRELINAGELEARKLDGGTLVTAASLERYIAGLPKFVPQPNAPPALKPRKRKRRTVRRHAEVASVTASP